MLRTLALLLVQGAAQPDSIAWQPWSTTVDGRTIVGELGKLRLPETHAAPGGPQITLAFVRLRGTGPQSASPIMYLAGGPGNSGIGAARIASNAALFDSLRTTGDLILIDQRGIGQSTPSLRCAPTLPPLDLFVSERKFRTALRAGMTACAASWRARGVHPEFYNTKQSAADIDALRRALGATRMRLFGFSYGTHLAQAILRFHGASVERAMLAGVEGLDDSQKLPLVLDYNLARMAESVRNDSTLRTLIPDLEAAFDSVLARLGREPAKLRIPNPLSPNDSLQIEVGPFGFQHIIARDLGDSNDWPLLPGTIALAAGGDYRLLTLFARKRFGPSLSLAWATMECASLSTDERAAEIAKQLHTSRFGVAMNLADTALCRALRIPRLGETFTAPLSSRVPTLFISGSLDANTPPYQAERIKWGFPNGVHVVVEGAGHESTLDVSAVVGAATRFMRGERVSSAVFPVSPPKFRGPGRS